MALEDSMPHLLRNKLFPVDEQDNPVAVAYAQLADGTFAPVKYDDYGRQVIIIDGVATPFVNVNGQPRSGLVDNAGIVQTAITKPVPIGDNKIGRIGLAANNPDYIYMHMNITEAITEIPDEPIGIDFTGYRDMIVDVKLEGVGSYVTLVPLVWNPLNQVYQIGQSKRFIENERAVIEVYGADDIYLLPVEVSGTISVVVSGY